MSDIEREMEALARELGGGWRIENPTGDPRVAMPILVLTKIETEILRDQRRRVVEALVELVRLKDGPRDDAYRAAKDTAWERARSVVGGQSA